MAMLVNIQPSHGSYGIGSPAAESNLVDEWWSFCGGMTTHRFHRHFQKWFATFFSLPGMWWGVVCWNINGFLKHIINMYYYVQVSFLFVLMLWISYRLKRHQDTSSLTVPTIGCKTFVIPSCLNWCWTMGWTLEKRDVVGFGIAGTKIQHWQLGKMTPFWLANIFQMGGSTTYATLFQNIWNKSAQWYEHYYEPLIRIPINQPVPTGSMYGIFT